MARKNRSHHRAWRNECRQRAESKKAQKKRVRDIERARSGQTVPKGERY